MKYCVGVVGHWDGKSTKRLDKIERTTTTHTHIRVKNSLCRCTYDLVCNVGPTTYVCLRRVLCEKERENKKETISELKT